MARVVLRSGESQTSLLRRFRRKVNKARILTEARRKRFFMSNSEKRRIAQRKAKRRERKRLRRDRSGRRFV
jgi:small subunit ribosomal protein S21